MKLAKIRDERGIERVAVVGDQSLRALPHRAGPLTDLLHHADLRAQVERYLRESEPIAIDAARFLPPIDRQEVWAAGVTYQRSQQARMEESKGAASFYDKVYDAPRPELFFKATASRAVGHEDPIRVRRDSRWSVPEPELTLVVAPDRRLVGMTIGNDVSARDIEGENPLYLPQAKVYSGSAALGPVIALADSLPPLDQMTIQLIIERAGRIVFEGSTPARRIRRPFSELIDWLFTENEFPQGVLLMTGTGIVPPDEISLADGDQVTISIDGIGTLKNRVVKRE